MSDCPRFEMFWNKFWTQSYQWLLYDMFLVSYITWNQCNFSMLGRYRYADIGHMKGYTLQLCEQGKNLWTGSIGLPTYACRAAYRYLHVMRQPRMKPPSFPSIFLYFSPGCITLSHTLTQYTQSQLFKEQRGGRVSILCLCL